MIHGFSRNNWHAQNYAFCDLELSQPPGCAANRHGSNVKFSALSATRREPANGSAVETELRFTAETRRTQRNAWLCNVQVMDEKPVDDYGDDYGERGEFRIRPP